jgi:dUTP pyrophosphatase
MTRPVLKYKKLSNNAFAPIKGSKKAAGFDLRAAYNYFIPSKGKQLIKTDLQVEIPEGCYGRIAPRSGLAIKNFIDVGGGVIDSDYRGNVGIVLFNFGEQDFVIHKGDRVAQLICEKIEYAELEEMKEALSLTERGDGGFGSTRVSD